jgi:hypothetical protein
MALECKCFRRIVACIKKETFVASLTDACADLLLKSKQDAAHEPESVTYNTFVKQVI